MIKQTYQDWQREVLTVAAASPTNWTFEQALGWFNAPAAEQLLCCGQVWKVANVLGLAKRHRMTWTPEDATWRETIGGVKQQGRSVACVALCHHTQPDGVNAWNGTHEGAPRIDVTGHPTSDSAIEHLERLLGREIGANP